MKTVLVIEDEVQTRNIFLKCLEFEGFRACGARNGSEGVKMATADQPDLVVCDIMMPDMDGYSVLNQLRRSPITAMIPLIFLTAKVTMAELRCGMALGADDYLTKPCTVEQFLSAIAARLQRQEQLQHGFDQAQIAGQLRASTATEATRSAPIRDSIFPDCTKLAGVFEFIETHFREAVNLSDVAQTMGYSPAYLTHLVQAQTGRSIKRWVIERRMAEARQLLRSTSASIKQIAERSGYGDAGYFTRQFRQCHGVSPQNWRQQAAAGLTQ